MANPRRQLPVFHANVPPRSGVEHYDLSNTYISFALIWKGLSLDWATLLQDEKEATVQGDFARLGRVRRDKAAMRRREQDYQTTFDESLLKTKNVRVCMYVTNLPETRSRQPDCRLLRQGEGRICKLP